MRVSFVPTRRPSCAVAVVEKDEPDASGAKDKAHQRQKLHPVGCGGGVNPREALTGRHLNVDASAKRQNQSDVPGVAWNRAERVSIVWNST